MKFTPDIKFVNDETLNEFIVTVERRDVGGTDVKNDSDREDRDKRDEEDRDNSLSSKYIENNEATKRDNDGAEETEDRARVVRTEQLCFAFCLKRSTFVVKKQKIGMPRKNSGMWYEVHPTPVKGEDGKNLLYVRPKSGLKLTMKELEDYCERWNMLRYGELSRAFEVLIRVAGRYLAEGYRIETPIGSFSPKLSLTKQVTDPDEVKDRDVKLDGVEYNPGKLWDKAIY